MSTSTAKTMNLSAFTKNHSHKWPSYHTSGSNKFLILTVCNTKMNWNWMTGPIKIMSSKIIKISAKLLAGIMVRPGTQRAQFIFLLDSTSIFQRLIWEHWKINNEVAQFKCFFNVGKKNKSMSISATQLFNSQSFESISFHIYVSILWPIQKWLKSCLVKQEFKITWRIWPINIKISMFYSKLKLESC